MKTYNNVNAVRLISSIWFRPSRLGSWLSEKKSSEVEELRSWEEYRESFTMISIHTILSNFFTFFFLYLVCLIHFVFEIFIFLFSLPISVSLLSVFLLWNDRKYHFYYLIPLQSMFFFLLLFFFFSFLWHLFNITFCCKIISIICQKSGSH